jgi:hypothetical protein
MSLPQATVLVAGDMIGTGVFLLPSHAPFAEAARLAIGTPAW